MILSCSSSIKLFWLVVEPPLWKLWKSVARMVWLFPRYGKIKPVLLPKMVPTSVLFPRVLPIWLWFQTTNQCPNTRTLRTSRLLGSAATCVWSSLGETWCPAKCSGDRRKTLGHLRFCGDLRIELLEPWKIDLRNFRKRMNHEILLATTLIWETTIWFQSDLNEQQGGCAWMFASLVSIPVFPGRITNVGKGMYT